MRIRYNRRLAEDISHNQVRALASHAGKRQQLLKRRRHFTSILIPEHAHTRADVSGFTAAETARLYDGFDLLRLCGGESLHIRIFPVKILHDHVHARIGTLSSQADTDQELPRLIIIQCTIRVRIFFFQAPDDLQRQFFL